MGKNTLKYSRPCLHHLFNSHRRSSLCADGSSADGFESTLAIDDIVCNEGSSPDTTDCLSGVVPTGTCIGGSNTGLGCMAGGTNNDSFYLGTVCDGGQAANHSSACSGGSSV